MANSVNRRRFLTGASILGLTQAALPLRAESGAAENDVSPTFPSQDPDQVMETVRVAHFNLDRLRELVDARPALAKAGVDLGFGDWESALGAASHMGRADIAEYLIQNGARPSLFSAAMMGQLEVVRAFIEASPGVQRIRGPHSITLLSHAKAGGEGAKEVVTYLESVGDAGSAGEEPLTSEQRKRYMGTYTLSSSGGRQLEVVDGRFGMMLVATGTFGPILRHVEDDSFYPAGAESVRVHFAVADGRAQRITIHDGPLVVIATRN